MSLSNLLYTVMASPPLCSHFLASSSSDDDDDDFASIGSQQSSSSTHQRQQLFFDQLDTLLDGTLKDQEDAYRMCLTRREVYRSIPDFYWRLAKATFRVSQSPLLSEEVRRQLVYEALEAARTAHNLDSTCASAHKWLAILLGSVGCYEGNQMRILNGYKFKEHIDQALALDPTDHAAHHLKGRWCYGVYMLTWWERRLAATLFATPPTATIEEAVSSFQEAERLRPGSWRENQLYLAKCYIETGDYPTTANWLRRARDLPRSDSPDDMVAQKEVDSLLAKYATY